MTGMSSTFVSPRDTMPAVADDGAWIDCLWHVGAAWGSHFPVTECGLRVNHSGKNHRCAS